MSREPRKTLTDTIQEMEREGRTPDPADDPRDEALRLAKTLGFPWLADPKHHKPPE